MTDTEAVSALNGTALVFHGDEPVISKLNELFSHWDLEGNLPEQQRQAGYERRNDLLAELISSMALALGYKFDHTFIKGRFYLPKGMTDESQYTLKMREQLLDLTSGKTPLTVTLVQTPDSGAPLPAKGRS